MANPFEDPDVANAQTYGGSAYEEPKPPPPPPQTNLVSRGLVALDVSQNTGDANATKTTNTSSQPGDNPPVEQQNWCVRLIKWIQIRWFAFLGGCLLLALTIVEIFNKPQFIDFFVFIYFIMFGIMIMFIEFPAFLLTRKAQLGTFFWFRLLSRSWGRAWFYIFVAIICFFQGDGFAIFVGIWMISIGLIMFIYSRFAAIVYVRIYIFIASGAEGDKLETKFENKFDELDLDRDGKIDSGAIVKVARQSGRELSNSERHAIQQFLDVSCNGSISKEDWWKQFSTYNIKQRFL